MSEILQRFADLTPRRFAAGESLMEEGRETGKLFVLKSGSVEVRRRGLAIATITEPGAVLGEMSALLDRPHTASVVATTPVEAFGLDEGLQFLAERPGLALHVAVLLAQRLETTSTLLTRLQSGGEQKQRDVTLIKKLLGFLTGAPPAGKPGARRAQPRPR